MAQLAGVPATVVRAAKKHLERLEAQAAAHGPQGDLFSAQAKEPEQAEHPVIEALRRTHPDALSPRDALELVYRLKKSADNED